ncbi:MAG: response regulator transcription factor [Bacteroidota bacterium]
MKNSRVQVLLIEDNAHFARLVDLYLQKSEISHFDVIWKKNGAEALREAETNQDAIDIILMDFFLPGQNGLEITKALLEGNIRIPVIFLTVNKEFKLAVEAMKLGVEDYLVKEEIATPVLPKTILGVLEKVELRRKLAALEISQNRLDAIQEMVFEISRKLDEPLAAMGQNVDKMLQRHNEETLKNYLKIIKDNLDRINSKITKLKELKEDKTVPYIQDIRMIDLS